MANVNVARQRNSATTQIDNSDNEHHDDEQQQHGSEHKVVQSDINESVDSSLLDVISNSSPPALAIQTVQVATSHKFSSSMKRRQNTKKNATASTTDSSTSTSLSDTSDSSNTATTPLNSTSSSTTTTAATTTAASPSWFNRQLQRMNMSQMERSVLTRLVLNIVLISGGCLFAHYYLEGSSSDISAPSIAYSVAPGDPLAALPQSTANLFTNFYVRFPDDTLEPAVSDALVREMCGTLLPQVAAQIRNDNEEDARNLRSFITSLLSATLESKSDWSELIAENTEAISVDHDVHEIVLQSAQQCSIQQCRDLQKHLQQVVTEQKTIQKAESTKAGSAWAAFGSFVATGSTSNAASLDRIAQQTDDETEADAAQLIIKHYGAQPQHEALRQLEFVGAVD